MRYPSLSLSGRMRSGKDTLAAYLIANYGYRKMSFAGPLKIEVAKAVGVHPGALDNEPLRSQIRQVLQVYGTQFRRAQDPDYWVKQARSEVSAKQFLHPERPIVFTDARFPNELDMLKGEGFKLILIDMSESNVRDYLRKRQNNSPEEINRMLSHASETAWQAAEFDFTIDSRPAMFESLYRQMRRVIGATEVKI